MRREARNRRVTLCGAMEADKRKMTRDEAVALLRSGATGIREWNARREEGESPPSLDGVELSADTGARHLAETNLSKVSLNNANLGGVSLSRANLAGARLNRANLSYANGQWVDMRGTYLLGARMAGVMFGHSDFSGAQLAQIKTSSPKKKALARCGFRFPVQRSPPRGNFPADVPFCPQGFTPFDTDV